MAEVRYYADEHIASAVTAALRRREIDVTTVQEADLSGADDPIHLAHAATERRVIVTQDDDFLKWAARGHPHAGIVYVPQGTPIGKLVAILELIHGVLRAEEMVGSIEFIRSPVLRFAAAPIDNSSASDYVTCNQL